MTPRRRCAFTFLELLIVFAIFSITMSIAVPNFLEAQTRSRTVRNRVGMTALAEALEAYRADHLTYPPNLEPFHPAPGTTTQPLSRLKLVLAPAPPPDPHAESEDDSYSPPGRYRYPAPPLAPELEEENRRIAALPRPHLDSYGGQERVIQSLEDRHYSTRLPGGKNVADRILLNGFALTVLTSPVAYIGKLPPGEFLNQQWRLRGFPIGYFHYDPYYRRKDWTLPMVGGAAPRYLLFTPGPDRVTSGPFDPYVGPFLRYDPTNGTISRGGMFALDGVIRP